LLADRYRLVRPLARGGMGSVWQAEHLTLGSEVAVKIIDPGVASRNMGVPRFLREARALAALRSPYIVQVIDFGSEGEIVYLVMELLEGRTLGQRLKAEGKLSVAETNRIMRQVCRAMSHAHERGIVHRDLKPDNIFLCDQSREHVTKVLDFGIAKPLGGVAAASSGTEAGAFLGTPSYMSPEQCLDSKDIDHRSDLWALGAIAYECLLGKRLFDGDVIGPLVVRICTEALPIASSDGALPAGFEAWLRKAMARNPADRFQSAADFSQSLATLLDSVAESPKGVDSAETLHDEDGQVARVQVASVGSTLDNGALGHPSQPRRSERASFRLVAAGLGTIGVLALVSLLRNGASSKQAPAIEAQPAASQAPPLLAPAAPVVATNGVVATAPSNALSAPGAASAEAEGSPADAGVVSDAKRKRSAPPAPVKTPPRDVPHSAPVQPAKPAVTAPDVPELEVLRRKR
jgi:eukaryotic-like serine/threonine-protein kinase